MSRKQIRVFDSLRELNTWLLLNYNKYKSICCITSMGSDVLAARIWRLRFKLFTQGDFTGWLPLTVYIVYFLGEMFIVFLLYWCTQTLLLDGFRSRFFLVSGWNQEITENKITWDFLQSACWLLSQEMEGFKSSHSSRWAMLSSWEPVVKNECQGISRFLENRWD